MLLLFVRCNAKLSALFRLVNVKNYSLLTKGGSDNKMPV